MSIRRLFALIGLVALLGIMGVGCAASEALDRASLTTAPTARPVENLPTPGPQPTATRSAIPTSEPASGIANPASHYCVNQGGKLEIRNESGGQVGYCVFPDGSECEEWAYFRGQCAAGSTEAVLDELAALVEATLPPGTFEGVQVLSLSNPIGSQPLWAAFTYGMRNYDMNPSPSHIVAIYTRNGSAWQQLGRVELDQGNNPSANAATPGVIDKDRGVKQVQIDPSRVWLEVQGVIGANAGTYHILSFDGTTLRIELAAAGVSPGFGSVRDISGDGTPDVVLDVSDIYVFCRACGVRKVVFEVHAWDAESQRMVKVNLQPLSQAGNPALEPTNRAVQLAQAGLWKDAMVKITEAKEAASLSAYRDGSQVVEWDYALIKLHADGMVREVAEDGYPLLANVFYGDYAAAVDMMRPYSAEQLFSLESPLIQGTPAQNLVKDLVGYLVDSTTSVVAAEPGPSLLSEPALSLSKGQALAMAYFVRGWAEYLDDQSSPQARADIARAAELAPTESLFAEARDLLGAP